MIDFIDKDDFVYLDLSYVSLVQKTNNFESCSRYRLDLKMYSNLLSFLNKMDKKGAKFLLSNFNTDSGL
ncbi:DNA adenine methylase [Borrelia anserina]|uniref:DNA adenine methylase n=1 Tax=Borrelia anserina BA2 TaxID=1313293 RepID=W5SP99_BORAN|nr:hypothetical protein [Borrelia anserina]AHH08443.1 DNA adenine methylase [Borrelia anserina BA2]